MLTGHLETRQDLGRSRPGPLVRTVLPQASLMSVVSSRAQNTGLVFMTLVAHDEVPVVWLPSFRKLIEGRAKFSGAVQEAFGLQPGCGMGRGREGTWRWWSLALQASAMSLSCPHH